jgi:hypothetical protein
MSDRILVMYRGRIQAEFTAAAATHERVLRAALGLSAPSGTPKGGVEGPGPSDTPQHGVEG